MKSNYRRHMNLYDHKIYAFSYCSAVSYSIQFIVYARTSVAYCEKLPSQI